MTKIVNLLIFKVMHLFLHQVAPLDTLGQVYHDINLENTIGLDLRTLAHFNAEPLE